MRHTENKKDRRLDIKSSQISKNALPNYLLHKSSDQCVDVGTSDNESPDSVSEKSDSVLTVPHSNIVAPLYRSATAPSGGGAKLRNCAQHHLIRCASAPPLTSALKGSRIRPSSLRVKWSPEVWDPPHTSASHTVGGLQACSRRHRSNLYSQGHSRRADRGSKGKRGRGRGKACKDSHGVGRPQGGSISSKIVPISTIEQQTAGVLSAAREILEVDVNNIAEHQEEEEQEAADGNNCVVANSVKKPNYDSVATPDGIDDNSSEGWAVPEAQPEQNVDKSCLNDSVEGQQQTEFLEETEDDSAWSIVVKKQSAGSRWKGKSVANQCVGTAAAPIAVKQIMAAITPPLSSTSLTAQKPASDVQGAYVSATSEMDRQKQPAVTQTVEFFGAVPADVGANCSLASAANAEYNSYVDCKSSAAIDLDVTLNAPKVQEEHLPKTEEGIFTYTPSADRATNSTAPRINYPERRSRRINNKGRDFPHIVSDNAKVDFIEDGSHPFLQGKDSQQNLLSMPSGNLEDQQPFAAASVALPLGHEQPGALTDGIRLSGMTATPREEEAAQVLAELQPIQSCKATISLIQKTDATQSLKGNGASQNLVPSTAVKNESSTTSVCSAMPATCGEDTSKKSPRNQLSMAAACSTADRLAGAAALAKGEGARARELLDRALKEARLHGVLEEEGRCLRLLADTQSGELRLHSLLAAADRHFRAGKDFEYAEALFCVGHHKVQTYLSSSGAPTSPSDSQVSRASTSQQLLFSAKEDFQVAARMLESLEPATGLSQTRGVRSGRMDEATMARVVAGSVREIWGKACVLQGEVAAARDHFSRALAVGEWCAAYAGEAQYLRSLLARLPGNRTRPRKEETLQILVSA